MNPIEYLHSKYIYNRRIEVLVRHLSRRIPNGSRVLDVGCGDGLLAKKIMALNNTLAIEGIDVLVRKETHIPIQQFNGTTIPHVDKSFDVVMFVDVLHHTENPEILLSEASRVARKIVLIKDHTANGFMAFRTLRFMDYIGNARHGVVLPYNYWPEDKWRTSFEKLHLQPNVWENRLRLYPPPLSWFFDRSLHFVSALKVSRSDNETANSHATVSENSKTELRP
jgi:SAM-dependent methyltransferase